MIREMNKFPCNVLLHGSLNRFELPHWIRSHIVCSQTVATWILKTEQNLQFCDGLLMQRRPDGSRSGRAFYGGISERNAYT